MAGGAAELMWTGAGVTCVPDAPSRASMRRIVCLFAISHGMLVDVLGSRHSSFYVAWATVTDSRVARRP
eukprot:1315812-Pyramimonas_sp.AAC.3